MNSSITISNGNICAEVDGVYSEPTPDVELALASFQKRVQEKAKEEVALRLQRKDYDK